LVTIDDEEGEAACISKEKVRRGQTLFGDDTDLLICSWNLAGLLINLDKNGLLSICIKL
jgi:hypothetical protein